MPSFAVFLRCFSFLMFLPPSRRASSSMSFRLRFSPPTTVAPPRRLSATRDGAHELMHGARRPAHIRAMLLPLRCRASATRCLHASAMILPLSDALSARRQRQHACLILRQYATSRGHAAAAAVRDGRFCRDADSVNAISFRHVSRSAVQWCYAVQCSSEQCSAKVEGRKDSAAAVAVQ